MDTDTAKKMIESFYDALNEPAKKPVAAAIEGVTTEDWRSHGSEGPGKTRAEFIGQVTGFGKLIPDLSWSVREVLVAGDRIVVRSEASGTPVGELFGVPPSGRKFRILAIDIHTVRDGKLALAYHVEDWATALRQLRAT